MPHDCRNNARSRTSTPGLPGHRAVEWLRALGESFQVADAPKEKEELMHAIYERITVAGPEIVGVRLTQAAHAHGLALALPEKGRNGAPDRIRTCDLRLRRPTLYPLSYRRARPG